MLIWLGGVILTVLGFVFGKVFNQSESILAEKRRVYEEFLRKCPSPGDVFLKLSPEGIEEQGLQIAELKAPLLLYASQNVILAISEYLNTLASAQAVLTTNSDRMHPAFKKAAKAQNDIILEMRRDALAWSAFAYTGKSRLPDDALARAKSNTLD
jgi:hypothetical protein